MSQTIDLTEQVEPLTINGVLYAHRKTFQATGDKYVTFSVTEAQRDQFYEALTTTVQYTGPRTDPLPWHSMTFEVKA